MSECIIYCSFSNFTTSASTFSKAFASSVSSSLTTRFFFLSLSDKSTADVVECVDVDYATGSFCSSCSIPPPMAHGFWSSGKGYAICSSLSCLVLLSFPHFSLWFWVRRFGVSFPLPYFFDTVMVITSGVNWGSLCSVLVFFSFWLSLPYSY